MGRKRPERDLVEKELKKNPRRKAHEIANEIGMIDTMGYDKAVDYVKSVKRDLRKSGEIKNERVSDEARLRDITALFDIRNGRMSQKAAYTMLLLNCYYRFRSIDDTVHIAAIDDTYEKNSKLQNPFDMPKAIHICDIALAQYMSSIDEEQNEKARKRGFPGAGLNYTDESLIAKLEITDEELEQLESIQRGE